jgi:hypothetical protein
LEAFCSWLLREAEVGPVFETCLKEHFSDLVQKSLLSACSHLSLEAYHTPLLTQGLEQHDSHHPNHEVTMKRMTKLGD